MKAIIDWFSAEWAICHDNGGDKVLLRAIWITLWLYSFALLLYSWSYTDKDNSVVWSWNLFDFSPALLKQHLHQTLPWLGAIFAAVYFSLYQRFVSQYQYLANLHNEITKQEIILDSNSEQGASVKAQPAITRLKAHFIVDAWEMHLAKKLIFGVRHMLEDDQTREQVKQCFDAEKTNEGPEAWSRFETHFPNAQGAEERDPNP